jgi:serine/threonine protein phosphatase PrpC
MMSPQLDPTTSTGARKPRDADIDVFGITHPGKVRKENQDHFLVAALHKQMVVQHTSLPAGVHLPVEPERLASLAMVADGVASGAGEEASRFALQTVAEYVAKSTRAFYTSDATEPEAFTQLLSDAALQCHADLLERANAEEKPGGYATTLTLWLGLWPQAYLLQLGDSRCYLYTQDRLSQITRDQTMAQDLVDQGVLSRATAVNTRWAHVLSSAIGGQQAAPVVTRVTREWGTIVMLCSDGLTKHVSDEQIAQRLGSLQLSRQTCEELLQDALDGGGSDNITIVIGRTVRPADT